MSSCVTLEELVLKSKETSSHVKEVLDVLESIGLVYQVSPDSYCVPSELWMYLWFIIRNVQMMSSLKGRYFNKELFLDALKDKYVRNVRMELSI